MARGARPWGGLVLIVPIVLSGALAFGGPPPVAAEGLTLAEAVDRALDRQPLLEAATQDRARAAAGVDRARAAFLPRLDAGYGYARSDQPVYAFGSKLNQGRFTEQDFEVGRLNSPGAVDNFRGAVTLRQPLYTGGRATLGLQQAEAARRVAELEAARTTQEVIFLAARAYFGLRLAQERLAATEASLRAADATLTLAESRFRAGLAVESDVLAARVRRAHVREEALTARSRVEVARAALNDATGDPLETAVEATEALAIRPAAPDEGLPADVLARRPDYRAIELQEEARARDVRLARAEFLPALDAEGTYEVNSAHPASDGQGSWSVMAVLRWNLFGGGADRARVREAEAAWARARALRTRAASQVGLEVRETRARLDAALERAAVADGAVGEAEEALRIVSVRYRAGLTTIVELVGAEAASEGARLRVTEARHDHSLALAAWELALGRLTRETFR